MVVIRVCCGDCLLLRDMNRIGDSRLDNGQYK